MKTIIHYVMEATMSEPSHLAPSTLPTRTYRGEQKKLARPESNAVHAAISAAVAYYLYAATADGDQDGIQRAKLLEQMAINFLISKGASPKHAKQRVRARTRRVRTEQLRSLVLK